MVARVISLGLNGREITGEPHTPAVMDAIADAKIRAGVRTDNADRYGGVGIVAASGAMDQLRRDRMADGLRDAASRHRTDSDEIMRRIDATTRDHYVRTDAARADAGLASGVNSFPRDFEHIYQQELEEKRAPLNMEKAFPFDTSVPLGARTHTVRRILGTGDAVVTRTGTDIPVIGQQRVEEQFPVIHIAAAVETDWFDMISNDFEGRRRFQQDTRLAIRVIRERMNQIIFFGDAPSDMYGVLNYPVLTKAVSPLTWKAGTGGSAPADIVADLNAGANFASETSGGTFSPTRLITSIDIMNFVMQTRMDSGTDTTIGDFWLRGQPDISSIEGMREMKGFGPAGEDGLLFYRDDLESTAAVVIQAPTAMPVFQKDSFRSTVVYIATIGGVIMRDVGNNNLRLAARS